VCDGVFVITIVLISLPFLVGATAVAGYVVIKPLDAGSSVSMVMG
jgi:hypothetical protein